MKHLKMLGLFVMAAASLMAFAGSASAATFTAPAGTEYTGALSASLEGGTATLKAGFANVTCTSSSIGGSITTNNEEHAKGPISSVNFSGCGFVTVTTVNPNGTLTIAKGTHVVSGEGVEVTTAAFGSDCIYGMGTGNTLGTASNTASGVTLAIKTKLALISGGSGCSNPAEWIANYVVTNPTGSVVD